MKTFGIILFIVNAVVLFYYISFRLTYSISDILAPLPISGYRKFPWLRHFTYISIALNVDFCFLLILGSTVLSESILGIFFYFPLLWLPLSITVSAVRSNPIWEKKFLERPKIVLFRDFNNKEASLIIFHILAGLLLKKNCRVYALTPPDCSLYRRKDWKYQLNKFLPIWKISQRVRFLKIEKYDWQEYVKYFIMDASLVVFHIAGSTSIYTRWELDTAIEMLEKKNIFIVLKDENKSSDLPPGIEALNRFEYDRIPFFWTFNQQRVFRNKVEDVLNPILDRLESIPISTDIQDFYRFLSYDIGLKENIIYALLLVLSCCLSYGIFLIVLNL